MELVGVLEGLLFINGSAGLSYQELQELLNVDEIGLKELIEELSSTYSNPKRGIRLEVLGNRLKLVTKPEHKQFYQTLVQKEENSKLSPSALETLAIIAYNEPITRIQIDEIRGVDSSYIIRKLLSKNLIYEVGKSDMVGHPNLYSTTDQFLDYFGLSSREELPDLIPLEESDEEKDLFTSKYQEI